MNYIYHYSSLLGDITLASDGDAIIGLWFNGQKYFALSAFYEENPLPVFEDTIKWLDIYFSGKVPTFTPKLSIQASPLRKAVYQTLLTIPYGQTITYSEIAKTINCKSAQAVGGAVAHNPISLIIPCHRVIGKDGSLVGYAGGVDRKKKLLEIESKQVRCKNWIFNTASTIDAFFVVMLPCLLVFYKNQKFDFVCWSFLK